MNTKSISHFRNQFVWLVLPAALLLGVSGCPYPINTSDYDLGFDEGFLQDDWYWEGYFDGYDTIDFTPIYYEGDAIPFIDDDSYDAGYWDGVWYAYNDGYFVDYRYAFILGFSEGYDNAYWPDYLDFLANDEHVEFLNGGWADGYNDGFSEGRVFGANDFEQDLPFDWLDALLDYESGTDLYFEEVDVGTGEFGPVFLYEYGTDPHTLKSATVRKPRTDRETPSIRQTDESKARTDKDSDYFRPLTDEARQTLEFQPETSQRTNRTLRLDTSWLERINAYAAETKSAAKAEAPARSRAISAETKSAK
ncbi:MAG: hypothetical protein HY706_12875 [Candidatus Hydrogenedentes bacterium]|nr:hypothetical protein [Candidatus Hydrogenedentota bacterium]